ncbi:MAG: ABC transporter substrate-binding protein, partial [Acutalibacteraceae bacterium]|nr:ABC transporter substrate-binding protein [Acutalibacteraceae bacterium]
MFRKVLSLLLALVIAVSLCACGGDSEELIIMPINADPMCLDPQVAETDESKLLIANCFEGLVRLDKDYKLVPGVAESWDISSDGLTYTFHLRKDTHWKLLNSFRDILPEDYKDTYRTQVIADDFVFGLRRAVDPA